MKNLPASARRALRAKAHALHPVVAIGQHGLTPAVLHEIDVALRAHELIKIRVFSGERDERAALHERICTELDAAPVQHIGKLLIVWRPAPPPTPAADKPGRPVRAGAAAAKPAGKKPRGNTRTIATAGQKRPPRSTGSIANTRRRSAAQKGRGVDDVRADAGSTRRTREGDLDPRRRPRGAKPAESRRGKGTDADALAASGPRHRGAGAPGRHPPRGAATPGRKAVTARTATPHGKSASSATGAAGARRRRKAR